MGELERWEVEEGLEFWLTHRENEEEAAVSRVFENLLDEVTDCANLGELPWETLKREKGIVK